MLPLLVSCCVRFLDNAIGNAIGTTSTSVEPVLMSLFSLSVMGRFWANPTTSPLLRLTLAFIVLSGFLALGIHTASAQSTASLHLVMGNPSGATTDTANMDNYLMQKPQYALSYNKSHATPNWVSWHLGTQDLGSASRSDSFYSDATLPTGWYRVTNSDYSGSGYDRGHNCPSGDRTATEADNDATFLLTNIVPQTADNNQGPWATLENYCRSLVTAGNDLFIISCPNTYSAVTIAGGKVFVPGYMSKVIVVLPQGSSLSASAVTTSTRVICVDIPNIAGVRSDNWQSYCISVDKLESYTGYDFLSNVSTSVQSVIEARVDSAYQAGTLPKINIANTSVIEGNSGISTPDNSLRFPITLSLTPTSNIDVNYSTSNGTGANAATAESDYISTVGGKLNIRAGQTTSSIVVPVVGDTNYEPNETMGVTLSSPSAATLGTSTATGTIVNDDTPAPTPTFTPVPTETPLPTATPLPTSTPVPTSTPLPDPTATPLPTSTPVPTATPEPIATATPLPTSTPAPTATVAPTATPIPVATSTPVPTATPKATATPRPTSTPVPTPTPVVVPRITVALSPSAPRTLDVLRAVVTSQSSKLPSLRFQWFNGSTLLSDQTGAALSLSRVGNGDKGDTITVKVTPYIGTTQGVVASARVRVENTPPLASSMTASARGGVPVEVLLQASDADGDSMVFSLSSPVAGGTATFVTRDGKTFLRYIPRATTTGQDIVRFKATDPSRTSAEATVTFTVTPDRAPVLVSVTPNTGNIALALPGTWTQIVKDADGPLDLSTVFFMLSPSARTADARGAVFLAYNVSTKMWTLMGDDGRTWSTPVALGKTLENSRASVTLGLNGVSSTRDGTLYVRWLITSKASFAGPKTIWARVEDAEALADGLRVLGTVTFGTPPPADNSPPSPSSGSS
ncbi:nuclease [Abditibacteriota bacterium]|nr:nuclease [Abditibacteriota bacterium]